MRILSWNLNGLPTKIERGDFAPIVELSPDIICLQEIRTQQEPIIIEQYQHYWNHGQMEGYFGTAVLCRQEPRAVVNGLLNASDEEGRAMTIELSKCYIINLYVPNSQRNLKRHQYRLEWDAQLAEHIHNLQEQKSVILCGDFNTTLGDLDVYEQNERQLYANYDYLEDERSNLLSLLEEEQLDDAFRYLHPLERSYTWWSNRGGKRRQNRGWRLDYFLSSYDLADKIRSVEHLQHIYGSDHCPILLDIDL